MIQFFLLFCSVVKCIWFVFISCFWGYFSLGVVVSVEFFVPAAVAAMGFRFWHFCVPWLLLCVASEAPSPSRSSPKGNMLEPIHGSAVGVPCR